MVEFFKASVYDMLSHMAFLSNLKFIQDLAMKSKLQFSKTCVFTGGCWIWLLWPLFVNSFLLKLPFLSFLLPLPLPFPFLTTDLDDSNTWLCWYSIISFWKPCDIPLLEFLRIEVSKSPIDLWRNLFEMEFFCAFSTTQRFSLLTNGRTMKNALGFTPIFIFGVASFLLDGKSSNGNHSHALISFLVLKHKVRLILIFPLDNS